LTTRSKVLLQARRIVDLEHQLPRAPAIGPSIANAYSPPVVQRNRLKIQPVFVLQSVEVLVQIGVTERPLPADR
jgi:hypothetical protein